MHRFQSQSVINRFRLTSYLICLLLFAAPAAAAVLVYAVVVGDRPLIIVGMEIVGAVLAVAVVQWIAAQRTRCPLCMTPVLASKHCSKHRNARTTLGSHRLRVALAVIFRGSFSCPYCNESAALQVRRRHAH